ncbi:MAG: bifunctional glutamate N-acetyltransferase/amino-acid acetyltransferase ArgJ [Gammaproteobacteria bacterium]|nr:MAG: bifunctional glutamate N-acetyltransferase/amino-acid acetyltransferase ArgJ [Gammaproteobacteria bacterium]
MAVGLSGDIKPVPVAGVRLGCAPLGVRSDPRDDLTVIELSAGSRAAAVFTRNAFCAAPVTVAIEHLARQAPRYLLINAGNANAGTGSRGLADARACCQAVAERTGCSAQQVLPFSTGVIGEDLPVAHFPEAVDNALARLDGNGWAGAARAIMTTDTVPKSISRQFDLEGHTLTVTGMVKGAGMMRPDMATMLAFVATDAAVEQALLDDCLVRAARQSFNRITVDGDTSTNDACVLMATGAGGAPSIDDASSDAAHALRRAVSEVCTWLAQAIVRDAEGASKFITIAVRDGRDEQECLQLAYAIAHSPLVMTAMYASDANWGRILAVVGRAGLEDLDIATVRIDLGDVCIVADGERAADYTEERGQEVMAADEINITVGLGRGGARATVWTSDLSHEYVTINAEYRT